MIAIPVYVREAENYKLLRDCLNNLTGGIWDESADRHIALFVNAWEYEADNLEAMGFSTHYREVNSVAGAWNDAIEMAHTSGEVLVIMNQDVKVSSEAVKVLKEQAYKTGIAAARTQQGEPDFALFAVYPAWVKNNFDTLRPFDEGFEGAYFEDNDFRYRCRLKGLEIPTLELDFEHYGSGVLKHDEAAAQENEQRFRKNHIRYINKWGGIRGAETFKTPFGK